MGSKTATTSGNQNSTSTNTLSPQVQAAYNSLLTQIGGLSNTSANAPAVNTATSGLGALSSAPNANYTNAASTLQSAAAPAYASISNYLSPYLNGALQTQIASQNQQNAQQQQGLLGNAAAQGALGGNRIGVAQGQLAGQQAIANNAANSSLINSAYQQASNAALSGQQNQTAAGSAQAGLGSSQNASSLSNLLGLLGAGEFSTTTPYSNLGALASSASGLSNAGETVSTQGTSTQTVPTGNTLSSLIGLGTTLAGLFAEGGTVRSNYATGGSVADMLAAANSSSMASNAAAIQAAMQAQQQQGQSFSPTSEQQKGIGNIKSWLQPAGNDNPDASGRNTYASGGLIPANQNRPGYADGGFVDFPYANYGDVSRQIVNAPPDIQPALIGNNIPVPSSTLNQVAAISGSPADMAKAIQPPPDASNNPAMQILPSGQTPQSRMAARDQDMASQGYPAPKGGLGALFAVDEQAHGLPPGYLSRTATIESNNNPTASNPSGAQGLFQFMPSTAAQYGLSNPNDPVASADAASQLAASNAKQLAAGLGRAPTGAELYLAHQQGAGGALGLITNPDAPAASVIGKNAVLQNGGNLGMSAGQFASMWEGKFNGASGAPNQGVMPSSSPANTIPIAGPQVSTVVPPPYGVQDSNAGYSTNIRDAFKSLSEGKGLNLSPDARMGLISAGLGIMGGTSPNALTNIGTGGQEGLKTWMAKQQLNRENALANSDIANQQGQLGLKTGPELYLEAQRVAAEVAAQTAQAGATNVNAARGRFVPTAVGMMEYDPNNPDATPKVIPWGQLTGMGAPSGGGAEPPPQTDQEGFVTTAPPAQGPNPLLMMGPDAANIVYGQTKTALGGAQGDAINAQALNAQLGELSNLAKNMPQSGALAPGAAFDQRLAAVKGLNGALQSLGIAPVDPQDVATAEGMKKLSTQLQFGVANSVKTDPAAATIAQAASASPSGENTQQGFSRIVGNIEALNKRSIDRYNFLQSWANTHYGDVTGADAAFNEANPPEKYIKYGEKLAGALGGQVNNQNNGQNNGKNVISTQSQYDALPSGSIYIAPDGKPHRKQ